MKTYIETSIIKKENTNFQINYFLIIKNSFYGVAAELTQDESIIAWERIDFLWENVEDALRCINQLAKNTVTPTTLVEILDECFF